MRVFATVWSVRSHLVPLLPLIDALYASGDDVIVATTAALAEAVAATGAAVEAVLHDPRPTELAATFLDPQRPPRLGSALADILSNQFAVGDLQRQAKVVHDLVRSVDPDLVLRDESEFAAYLAAQRSGIPVVCTAGAMSNVLDTAALLAAINPERTAFGLPALDDPAGVYPGPVIDYLPEDLSFGQAGGALSHGARALRLRQPSSGLPDDELPAGLVDAPPGRPVVYVAVGTGWRTWADQGGSSPEKAVTDLITALAGVDCTAVVSTGGIDPARLPGAANVHVHEHVPQLAVLECADLFCTHGGYNSIREAIRAGVPMLVRPGMLDQPANAARVAELGLGSVLPEGSPVELQALIAAALADPAPPARVRWAQRRVLSLPPIAMASAALRALAGVAS